MLDVGRGREQFVGMSGHQTAEFRERPPGYSLSPPGYAPIYV
jgi:hypothetical protein